MAISSTFNPNAPTGRTTTGAAIGNREDLSNELTLLAPEETPLLSLCAKGGAKPTFADWTAGKCAAPGTVGISEGTE